MPNMCIPVGRSGGGGGSASIYGVYSCVNVKPSVDGIFSPDVLCIVYSVYMYCA